MSQNLISSISGLNTNANQIGKVLPGSLSIAKNIVIDKDGVAEPRRGFDYFDPANTLAPTSICDRIVEFESTLIVHDSSDNSMWYYDFAWVQYNAGAPFAHPDINYAKMHFLKSSENLYFTTSTGVKVINTALSGSIYSTGMPKGLDGSGSLVTGTWFVKNNQVAYRIVWGTKDVHNNLFLGTPSQRIIVVNPSGGTDHDVSLTFTIPAGITTSDFYQIYRSKLSGADTITPNDELQLVYENNPSAGQITAKSVTVTDSTPVSLMGAALYTNSSQEGLSQSNDIPPVSKDLALFKGYTFFANTRTRHQLYISLLAVDGTSGLQLNDTITINGMVFTAKATETIANREFKLTTTGSAAQNIEDTAKSLVKVINQYASNTTIYAYYVSEYEELPGQILLEKRNIDEISFSVIASRPTVWDLDDGVSDNQVFVNGLAWSKNQQPEHVPLANLERVGSSNFEIRRILALRDSLFILKEDGVFRLTGSGGSWSIDPLDTSTKIIAPDTAVVINNQIFCLSDQGVVAISDVGVEIKSIPIENQILELYTLDQTKIKTLSFGVSYETDRKYLLWTVGSLSDTHPTQAFVYNTITNKWTKWEKSVSAGVIAPSNDKQYYCEGNTSNIFEERKTYTDSDFSDQTISTFTMLSYVGKSIVLDTIVNIAEGDILYQTDTKKAIVTSVIAATNTVLVSTEVTWILGATSIIKAIDCDIEFTNLTNDNAGLMKHYQEIAWLFRQKGFLFATTSFYTDLSGGYDDTTIVGDYGGGNWGAFLWGQVPWGGILRPKPIRVFVPREKSRGSLLSLRLRVQNAMASWSLNGVSLQFEYVSERMTRE